MVRDFRVVLRDHLDRKRYAYEVRAARRDEAITRARAQHTRRFRGPHPDLWISSRPAGVVHACAC